MEVNNAQITAITHNKGTMMVLAGPGSGKTLVITRRTEELVTHYGVKPERILVVTFTKAAAAEMKERFIKLSGGINLGVNFGTFHAVFFMIIKYAYQYKADNILREEDRYRILREAVSNAQIELEDEKEFLESLSSEISMVKSERIRLENYYSANCSEASFKKLFEYYQNSLRSHGLIDFDDMLLICHELLQKRADILEFWQQRYEYVLIDEFQDINRLQYEIIRLLAKPQDNMFIVGDDDQSIYRFRGARPEIMLGFPRDYPQTKSICLDINYRCASGIVKASLLLIQNNKNRFDKQIAAARNEEGTVDIRTFSNPAAQNDAMLETLLGYSREGRRLSDIAVLFRTNTEPRSLIEKLIEYNIPFHAKDRIPDIYDHWVSANVLAYISFANGNTDRGLFLQICNRPKRYITRDSLEASEVSLESLCAYYRSKPYVVEKLTKLQYDLAMLRKLTPSAAVTYIRKAVGYEDYLKEYAEYRRINVNDLLEVLDELYEGAKNYSTYAEWLDGIENYRKELKRQEQMIKSRHDGVELMTYHSAKGLEFDEVFIINANEGITPHRRALLSEDIEEERRMFYVAMTRAKTLLHIYSLKERYGKKLEPSRFLGELMLDRASLVQGQRISHVIYGEGEILKCREGRITIRFDKNPIHKTLDLELCIQKQLIKTVHDNKNILPE